MPPINSTPYEQSRYHGVPKLRIKILLNSRVAGLCIVLDDIKNNLSGLRVTDKQAKELSELIKGCRSVLNDTEQLIRKNESLGSESSGMGAKTQKAWKKLKWDSATVNELRDRMVSSTIYLNAFNTSLARLVSSAIKWILLDVSDIANMKRGVYAYTHIVRCPE